LCRRIGLAYSMFVVTPDERATIDAASTGGSVVEFEDMDSGARELLIEIENRETVMDRLAALTTTE